LFFFSGRIRPHTTTRRSQRRETPIQHFEPTTKEIVSRRVDSTVESRGEIRSLWDSGENCDRIDKHIQFLRPATAFSVKVDHF
jgi:hypothetical protein